MLLRHKIVRFDFALKSYSISLVPVEPAEVSLLECCFRWIHDKVGDDDLRSWEKTSSTLTPHWDKGTPYVALMEQLKQWSFIWMTEVDNQQQNMMHLSQKSLKEGWSLHSNSLWPLQRPCVQRRTHDWATRAAVVHRIRHAASTRTMKSRIWL